MTLWELSVVFLDMNMRLLLLLGLLFGGSVCWERRGIRWANSTKERLDPANAYGGEEIMFVRKIKSFLASTPVVVYFLEV